MDKKSRTILSENNISITNPRVLVIEELLKYKQPLTVEVLQKKLKGQVAVSTLYRVLNDLKKINLLNEFTSPENVSVVELNLHDDSHHHHLFCTSCGEIIDIDLGKNFEDNISSEINKIQKMFDFEIHDHTLELLGLCSGCKKD
ncbi:MAG: transcriptional repressor [Candidatus Actinomarinales bacterium]|nr:MAG: transcriptional repressor [Candidatus Actinomarinales bacterium]|tara:strand:- start:101 stop:532 length:432 start_codon:yes stop_codon:yes gene_type:complete